MKRSSLLFAAALAACGQPGGGNEPADAEFTEATPDVDALTIDVSTSGPVRAAGDKPWSMIGGEAIIQELNEHVRAILTKIKTAIAQNPHTKSKTAHVWVLDEKGVTYRFTVKKAGVGIFGWKLEIKKSSEADPAFVKVMGGAFKRGDLPRRGAGTLAVDLDTYKAVAEQTEAAIRTVGKIFLAFRHGPKADSLVYRLKGFSSDPATRPPLSAYFDAHRIHTTPVRVFVRAGGLYNFDDTSALLEKGALRLRRIAGLGGWARAVLFDGDLAERHVVNLIRECWNAREEVAYRRVWECTAGHAPSATSCTLLANRSFPSQAQDTNDPSSEASLQPLRQLCFPDAPLAAKQALLETIAAEIDPAAETDTSAGETAPPDGDGAGLPPPVDMPSGDGNDLPG